MHVFLAQEEAAEGSLLFPIIMLVGLFAIFYFMLIRPNKRRKQAMESLQSQLDVGDEVMTSGGLYGTVAELDEKTVILETSEGVYSRYARGAIVERVTAHDAEETGDDSVEEPESHTNEASADPFERREGKD